MQKLVTALLCSSAITLSGGAVMAQEETEDKQSVTLEEIVITARFKEEGVQDIGGSVAALGGSALARDGLDDFDDIAGRIVGLGLIDRGPNQNDISIRGVSNALAATTLDVLPGASAAVAQFYNDVSIVSPDGSQRDFNLFDLNRVEVLRGPQPTLFGEGSAGGTVRYFSNDPTLDGAAPISGKFNADLSFTKSGGFNYMLQGMVDATLVPDQLGIRATAFYRDNDGFIDNPTLGVEDANTVEGLGGSLTVLARPTEDFSIKLFAKVEEDDNGEAWFVDQPVRNAVPGNPILGGPTSEPEDLTYSRPLPGGPGFNKDDVVLLGATLEYSTENFTITSITGYYERDRNFGAWNPTLNLLSGFANLADPVAVPDPTTRLDRITTETQFTQELRFVTGFDAPVNFTGGLYYRNGEFQVDGRTTNVPGLETIPTINGPTPFPFVGTTTRDTEQISGFLEGTVDVSDRFRVIAGVRYVDEEVIGEVVENRTILPAAPGLLLFLDTTTLFEGVFDTQQTFNLRKWLPRASVEYDISDDALVYANWARGVRNGGVNQTGAVGFNTLVLGAFPLDNDFLVPLLTYGEDETESWEVGVKSTLLDGAMTLNVALFQNDFNDVQTGFAPPGGFNIIVNAADQRARGIELETSWAINDYFTTFGGFTYNDVGFREDVDVNFDGVITPGGDILEGNSPVGVAEVQFNWGLDYVQDIGSNGLQLTGGVNISHLGERQSQPANLVGTQLDALTLVNARFGVAGEGWSVSAYVDNLTNELEFVNLAPGQAFVNQPRVIGISTTFDF